MSYIGVSPGGFMSTLSVAAAHNLFSGTKVGELVDSDIGQCSICKVHLMLDSKNDDGRCPNCKEGVLYLHRWKSTIDERIGAKLRLYRIKVRDKMS